MMRTWSNFVMALALAGALGCGKNGESTCETADDCGEGQVCEEGACHVSEGECSGDSDCTGDEVCVANRCAPDDDEPDVGSNDVDNTPMPDMRMPDEDAGTDMNFDNIPPEVVAITPEDGSTDVALDTNVTVEFNEPMREATINVQSIEVRDPANVRVPADVSYDVDTMTATIAPMAPLRQATPYIVVVTTFVRDEAYNPVTEESRATFYTTYDEPADLRAVAETWAPHIYQAIGETTGGGPNADIPTRVDFDGNFKARDNREKAVLNTTDTDATVHYNVVESKTHYFITYALYYPMRKTTTDTFEHDFTGAVFVVDKATERLRVVDGTKVQEGSDTVIGFKPDDSDVNAPAVTQFETFPAAALEDGTHYPMFVPAGEHEACNWVVEGNPPVCLHNASEFPQGPENGVVLKPGAAAETWDDATTNDETGLLEMSYELVPLATTLWARRTDVGMESLWQQTQIYTPAGMDRPETTSGGATIVLPNRLFSDDDVSFGKPPFQWLKTSTESNNGQWLIDPAYLLLNRYEFSEPWSQEYCYNVFLDLDLRGDDPECTP